MKSNSAVQAQEKEETRAAVKAPRHIGKYLASYWPLYLMLLPGFLVLLIFCYLPMSGIILAFKDFDSYLGIFGSPWSGFENFRYVFAAGSEIWQKIGNTLLLGVLGLVFAFPSSIILALMINEVNNKLFKRTVQTISYLPYFVSWVVVASIVYTFFSTDNGLINKLVVSLGGDSRNWYSRDSQYWWPWILTLVGIWKTVGWGTITFLAGMTGISPSLYEAAKVDGANRWKQTVHVTIPGIMPVIGITFILTVANLVKDDFEKIYAIVGANSSSLSQTTDVLGTWTYRTMRAGDIFYGQVTAVTLIQSIVSLALMMFANSVVKKTGNPPLW